MGTHQHLPSLSQEEAAERANLLNVNRYDIDVDLTGLAEGTTLRTRSTVTFECTSPGASTFIDCAADPQQVSLNGSTVGLDAVTPGRIRLDGLERRNVLVVEALQSATEQASGVHRSVDASDGEVYVWMSFEPDDARRAWACFDQPDFKAPHAFSVLAPSSWTVLSNSGDPSVKNEAGHQRWTFADTPPLSSYIPVVNAGPFVERRTERNGHDLGLLARRSLTPLLDRDAEELFEVTAAGLYFYGEQFAMPFPQRRYDQVFVPNFGGAMENYGCVTWNDNFLFRSTPSPAEREWRAIVLLHEMAHMWFGDMVTMRWWDDLWLNEAFATWAAYWSAGAATEWSDSWATFLVTQKTAGYRADRSPATHPIRQPARTVAEAAAGFDDITYLKGASVLKQLVAYVGEEAFLTGLRSYFVKHQWGNATLDDLMSEIASASHRDLDRWTSEWLDRAGTDELALERSSDGSRIVATGSEGQAPRSHRLDVGVYARDAGKLVRRDLIAVDVHAAQTALPDTVTDADVLLLNDEDLTFADVLPDHDALQALVTAAGQFPSPLGRALAVSTAWNRLTTDDLAPSAFVRCVLDTVTAETSESLIGPFLRLAVSVADLWSDDATRQRLLEEVADACMALNERGGSISMAALRSLALVAVRGDHFAVLQGAHDDLEQQWRLQARLSELGRHDSPAVAALKGQDPDPEVWAKVVIAETAQPDANAKQAAWQIAMEERRFPVGSMSSLSRAFWRPGQEALVAPYAERYLEALPDLVDGGMLAAGAIAATLFPVVGVREDFIEQALATAEHADLSPMLVTVVIDHVDLLGRMLASRRHSS